MLEPLTHLRTRLLFYLAKRDVAAADHAAAEGISDEASRLLARADARLKKACGLDGWVGCRGTEPFVRAASRSPSSRAGYARNDKSTR